MIIFDGKNYIEVSQEEIKAMERAAIEAEREYWANTSYDEAVNAEIRKKYSESQEFAILRQAANKPEEYNTYFAYCEECKAYVKEKQKGVE